MSADRQQLVWVILLVGLPGILSLLLKLVDMRRVRQEHQDKTQETAQNEEAAEKKRQDETVLSLVTVVHDQVGAVSLLAGKIDAMTQELNRSNDLNEARNLLRDKRDTEQTGAIREQTGAIAQNTLNLADVESVVDETKEAVSAIPAHIDKVKDAVVEKVDSAVERSLAEIANKLAPILAQLTAQTHGIEGLQVTVGTLQKKLDDVSALLPPDLKDFREKFNDLKATAEKTFNRIAEMNQATHATQSEAAQMVAQVEALQNPPEVSPQ